MKYGLSLLLFSKDKGEPFFHKMHNNWLQKEYKSGRVQTQFVGGRLPTLMTNTIVTECHLH